MRKMVRMLREGIPGNLLRCVLDRGLLDHSALLLT